MKGFSVICLLILLSQGCREEGIRSREAGIWVNASSVSDTLIFNNAFNDPGNAREYFELRRGTEIRNGHKLPKRGSGIYEYKISGNSISVYNTLSSCYCFGDYFYEMDENLRIGDFYENDQPGQILTFVRLP